MGPKCYESVRTLEIIMSNKKISEILNRYYNDKGEDSMIDMASINRLIA